MGFDRLAGLLLTHVPDFEFLVVAYRCEFVAVVMVPADVFNHLGVGLPRYQRVDCWGQLVGLANVPDANLVVVTARQKVPVTAWVPVETVAFHCMSEQSKVGSDLISLHASMFEIVKDVDLAGGCLRGNDLVLLRHVPGSVYLALMVDLEFDLDALVLWNGLGADSRGLIAWVSHAAKLQLVNWG